MMYWSIAISSVINTIPNILCGEELFEKIPESKIKKLILMLVTSILATINYILFDNILKMVTMYLIIVLFYKLLFQDNMTKTLIAAFFMYIINASAEIIYVLLLMITNFLFEIGDISNYTGTILSNTIIAILMLLILKLIYKKIKQGMVIVDSKSKLSIFIVIVLIFLALSTLFYKMAFYEWKYNYEIISDTLLVIIIITIGIIIIIRWIKYVNIENEYQLLMQYSEASEQLIQEYKITNHENKNQLIVIRSLANENQELTEYLNHVIKETENTKNSIINNLKYITFGGLKGFIYYKLQKMKELNIELNLSISKNIKNSSINKLNIEQNAALCKLIGIYLDNAFEATKDYNRKKRVELDIFAKEHNTIIMIMNDFDNKKMSENFDKIKKPGISTKGTGRGHGLSLANRIIEKSEIFKERIIIKEDIFTLYLEIKKEK